MSDTKAQAHHKFKVFSGELGADHTMGQLATRVESWVRASRVAPKSIGIEYLEAAGRLLLSIGYRDDGAQYAVKLTTVHVGRVEALEAPDLTRIEEAMGKASGELKDVICHELYVTDTNDLLMVFMTRVPS